MKKSVFKSGLVAAIAVGMRSCTTTANAQTGNTKYIYGQDGTSTTVYTPVSYTHLEALQEMRVKARWEALDKESIQIAYAKEMCIRDRSKKASMYEWILFAPVSKL